MKPGKNLQTWTFRHHCHPEARAPRLWPDGLTLPPGRKIWRCAPSETTSSFIIRLPPHANAIELPFENGSFDVVHCQQGLQFFSDRAAAVLEVRRALAEDGRIALRATAQRKPLFDRLDTAAARQFGPRADRRFSLRRRARDLPVTHQARGPVSHRLDRRENALLPRRREFPSIEPLGGSRKSLPKRKGASQSPHSPPGGRDQDA